MKLSAELLGWGEALNAIGKGFDHAQLAGMKEAGSGLKADLADQVEGIYGPRVARTWKLTTYPNRESGDAGPAAFVWSKAPNIIRFAAADQIVHATSGRFLAIPTDDCPRKAGGGRMSVEEVEARFGRRLQFIEPGDRGFHTPSRRGPAIAYLVLKNLVVRKATQRYRNASARELASGRKPLNAVIMFVLVQNVRGRKQIDLPATARRWAGRAVELILDNIGAMA